LGFRAAFVFMAQHFDDILIFSGLASLFTGTWLIFPPAAWIVLGLCLLSIGLAAARGRER
jgi:hypothetical protein